jgi:hypothetical protein
LDSYHGTRSLLLISRIFVRFSQNLNARHAITAVPGTPAGFPESKFLKAGFRSPVTLELPVRTPEAGF